MKKRRKKRKIVKFPRFIFVPKKPYIITLPEIEPGEDFFRELDDEKLARACAIMGSENAWRVLEERFRGLAFYICGYWGLGAHKEEIWQDSLFILYEKIRDFKEGNFPAFIARIVYYKTREKIRELKKYRDIISYDTHLMELEMSVEETIAPKVVAKKFKHLEVPDAFIHLFYEKSEEERISRETINMINKALKRLPQIFRKVIKAYYFKDLNVIQISKRYRIPINTVLTRLKRARAKLLDIVKKYYPELLEE